MRETYKSLFDTIEPEIILPNPQKAHRYGLVLIPVALFIMCLMISHINQPVTMTHSLFTHVYAYRTHKQTTINDHEFILDGQFLTRDISGLSQDAVQALIDQEDAGIDSKEHIFSRVYAHMDHDTLYIAKLADGFVLTPNTAKTISRITYQHHYDHAKLSIYLPSQLLTNDQLSEKEANEIMMTGNELTLTGKRYYEEVDALSKINTDDVITFNWEPDADCLKDFAEGKTLKDLLTFTIYYTDHTADTEQIQLSVNQDGHLIVKKAE